MSIFKDTVKSCPSHSTASLLLPRAALGIVWNSGRWLSTLALLKSRSRPGSANRNPPVLDSHSFLPPRHPHAWCCLWLECPCVGSGSASSHSGPSQADFSFSFRLQLKCHCLLRGFSDRSFVSSYKSHEVSSEKDHL